MADDGDVALAHPSRQRPDGNGQLRGALHQAGPVVIVEAGRLLAVERVELRE